ncbi:uncharacterized protein [Macaca nemestrina]|uniref:uncharacterized protein isoform X7 n=1 Tax=Macaca nemestrina TaxID=9545 RepID=UPI0039B978D1
MGRREPARETGLVSEFICLCSCHFLTILQLRSTLEIILHKKEATWKTHHCAGSQAEGIFLVLDETFDLDFWVKILHLHPWATVSGISASATQPQPTRVCRERSPLPATKLLSENYLILSQVVIRFLDFEWWRPVPATSLIS